MVFTTLLHNAALLLSLGYLYSLISRHWYSKTTARQIYKGVLFGCFAIGVMANPMQFMPGVVFDTRSVVVSVAGLFGGLIPVAITVVMAVAFRLLEGGQGALTGVLVILVSAVLGLFYRHWSQGEAKPTRAPRLYIFGMAVHVAMLLCMFTLPWPMAWEVLRKITLPVLLIYPLVTMLLAMLLADGESRIQATKDLEVSENRFRASFDDASGGMIMTAPDGKLIRVNRQFCQMLDYTSRELVGKYFNDITHPDDYAVGEDFVKKMLAGETSSAQFEKRYLRKDGSPVWAKVSAALVRDTEDRPLNFITMVQDISKTRAVSMALSESEARYRQIVETADEGIWTVDADHKTTFVNKRMAAMLGRTTREMLDCQPHEFMPEGEVADHQAKMRARRKGEIGHYERRFRHKDGSEIWCMASVSPVFDDQGRFDGALGMFTDITDRKIAEGEHQEAVLRQEEAVKAGNVGLWDWDLVTNQVSFSTEWKSQIGYQDHEIEDRFEEWESRVHSDDLKPTLKKVEDSIATANMNHKTEFRFRHKDGSYRWILSQASVVTDESGRPVRMLGSHVDITERKQVEKQLIESERRYRSLFENMNAGFVLFEVIQSDQGDPEDLVILAANEGFAATTGLRIDEVIGKRLTQVLPGIESDAADWIRTYGEIALTGESKQFEQSSEHLGYHYSISAFQSAPKRCAVTFIDITERKKAEIALRQSEERFRRALAHMPDVLVIYDPDLRIRYINEATKKLTGYPPSHYIGKTDEEIWPPEVVQKYLPALKEAADILAPRSTDVEILLPDKKELHLTIDCIPLTDEHGNLVEVLGITHDLTERVRSELEKKGLEAQLSQAQKMEALGTLAGGIAHDFNNILSAILGYTELVVDNTQADSVDQEHLNQVLVATGRAQKLVRQILAFSRKAELQSKPVDLNKRVTTVVELISQTIPKMINIEVHLAEDLRLVNGDPFQLEQVLMNLTTNANDAMPEGGRLIIETEKVHLDQEYTRTHLEAVPGDYVCLQVSDTGHGMTKEVMKQIFDPFYTTKEIGRGTGLGLATTFGIVKAHGGFIYCYSEPGEGTTFKIYLPTLEMDHEPEVLATPQTTQLPRGDETILLVDDEQALRELGQLLLSKQGYSVLVADSGEQALDIYRRRGGDVHLVIMDISMPGMGGLKCLKELFKIDPSAKVLMASGYSRNGQLKGTLNAGALGYIAKPFNRADLLRTVRDVLDSKE